MTRPPLTPERIVATAIRTADERGLEAVTLRSIAKSLKVHVTSLYNHIPTKDALLEGMIESLVAEAELPVGSLTWQEWVRSFAGAMRALANRHPGAFRLFLRRPAQSMQAMESLEAAASAFRADGFDEMSTYCAIKAVNVAVVGLMLDEVVTRRNPSAEASTGELPADRFPRILEIHAVREGADTFEFVLSTLITGLSEHRDIDFARP